MTCYFINPTTQFLIHNYSFLITEAMKTFTKLSTFFLVSFFFSLFSTESEAQTSYVWDGSSSSAWTTAANWTPSGVPTSSDHVTITSAGTAPVLAANATVTNFSITSGTLDLGGYELTVSGTMSVTAGTLQNGLVKKTSTSALTITNVTVNCELDLTAHTITVNSSRFKQEVSLSKTGGTSTTMSGNVWEAPVQVSHTAPDATLTLGGTAADTVLSDMELYGSSKGILLGNSSGSGNMIFARTNPQLLTITGTVTGKRVTVNKPSGNVELSGTLVIGNYLNLTKGIVRVKAGGLVKVNSLASATGTSNLSYVDGPVEKAGNQAFTFPVGRNGVYRPISITAPSSSSHRFKAEYFESNSDWAYGHSSKDGSIGDISEVEYWILDRTNGTSNVTVTLSWDTVVSCEVDTLADLLVAVWDGSTWKDRGNGGTTGTQAAGTVKTSSSGLYYSAYAIGTDDDFPCTNNLLHCGPLSPISDTISESFPLSPTLGDRFGNKYHMESVGLDTTMRGDGSQRNVLLCSAGYYNLYFETGSGMEDVTNATHNARRAAVCAAFSDLSDFIPSPLISSGAAVNVWIRDIENIIDDDPAFSGVLGAASAFYVLPPPNSGISGIIDNQVWVTINSGTDAYTNVVSPLIPDGQSGNFYHSFMAFNFDNPSFHWWTDVATGGIGLNRDLYSVVLHEAIHALGFASLIDIDGNSKLGPLFPYYSRYDMFLQTQAGQNLVTNTGSCSLYEFGFSAATSDLASGTTGCVTDVSNCATAIEYSGAVDQLVYTPNCFEPPSTLSHFEDQCQVSGGFSPGPPASDDLYFVMSNANGTGSSFVKRYLRSEERLVFCDLGYEVVDEFGGSAYTSSPASYSGGDCPGLHVAGINDGLTIDIFGNTVYAYGGDVSTAITISDGPTNPTNILGNDFNANQFSCLEPIFPSSSAGTLNVITGTGATFLTYTPLTPGIHVLRYIPKNTTSGNEGNITYIYVYARSANCTPSVCDLVSNGGFESGDEDCGQISHPNLTINVDCWDRYSATPDVLGYDCSSTNALDLPYPWLGMYLEGTETHNTSANGNENFLHCAAPGAPNPNQYRETAQTMLSSPILPDESYMIRFWAKRGSPFNSFDNVPFTVAFYAASNPNGFFPPDNIWFSPPLGSTLIASQEVVLHENDPVTWDYFEIPYSHPPSADPMNVLIVASIPASGMPSTMHIALDDISILPLNSAPIIDIQPIICQNQVVSVGVTPPGGVLSGSGTSCPGGNCIFDATVAGVGQHTLMYVYTDPSTSCELTTYAQVEVIDSDFGVVASADPTSYYCYTTSNDDLELTATPTPATGGITYEWSPGAGTANPWTIDAPMTTTLYTVTAIAPNGCIATDDVNVTVGTGGVSVAMSSTPSCQEADNGTATAVPSGGSSPYTYLWDDLGAQTTATATGLAPAVYTVRVTDNTGCISFWQVTIGSASGCCLYATDPAVVDETFPFTVNPGLTVTVAGTTIANQTFTVNGTWTITSGNTLYLNDCDIAMGEGAEIIVENGAVLQIENTTHIFACDEMWGQIEVENGGDIRIIGNSIIEDAFNAVLIREGAYFKITDAIFNRNYFHIVHFFVYGSYPINTAGGTLSDCQFLCQTTASIGGTADYENLHAPYSSSISQLGIYSVVVEKLVASNCEFSNLEYGVVTTGLEDINLSGNTFEDITEIGIYVTEGDIAGGDVDIVNNEIYRTPFGIFCYDNPQAELKIQGNEIDFAGMASPVDVMIGILVEEVTPGDGSDPNTVSIVENVIENAPCGIRATNMFGTIDLVNYTGTVYIGHNDITHTKVPNDGQAGIHLQNLTGAMIIDNDVTHPSGNVNWWETGIRQSQGNTNWLICNNTHDVGRGIFIDGTVTPFAILANNTMEHNQIGLFLNWGVIGAQGSDGNPWDNQWPETGTWWSGSNPNTHVEGTDGGDSPFWIQNTYPFVPSFNNDGAFGFPIDVNISSSGSWALGCLMSAPSYKMDAEGPTDADRLTELLGQQETEPETDRQHSQQWMGEYGIYKKLLMDAELRNATPELSDFFQSKENSNMGNLHHAMADFNRLRNAEMGGIYSASSQEHTISLQLLVPENRAEQTLREVMRILYDNVEVIGSMHTAQEIQLREIAQRCPLDDGFGVYMARAALLKVDTLPRSYLSECERSPAPQEEDARWKDEAIQNNQAGVFAVYPNPNNGRMMVSYSLTEGDKAMLSVYTLIGELVMQHSMKNTSNRMEVDLTNVGAGVYLLNINVNGENKLVERLSILRE
jgi:hypothetical protein